MDNYRTLDNFIKTFAPKDKRERSELGLRNGKKRSRFSDRLHHKRDTNLDMRFVERISFRSRRLSIHKEGIED
jgi:hypothetical protein